MTSGVLDKWSEEGDPALETSDLQTGSSSTVFITLVLGGLDIRALHLIGHIVK